MSGAVAEGMFFTVTPEEAKEIYDYIEEMGYERTNDGVRDFLLDVVTGDIEGVGEEKKKGPSIAETLAANPDAVLKTVNTLASLLRRRTGGI